MKTLGICFGATTVQFVVLCNNSNDSVVEFSTRISHEGNPRKTFLNFLAAIDLSQIDRIAITGRHFRSSVHLSSIPEVEALECALKKEYPEGDYPDLVVSAGGETQLVYKVGKKGNIISVYSGNKCASGTGEFFLQQIGRMNLTVDDAVDLACKGTPHKIAGRCSVFCKSDCTHALNKGEPKANIVAGLCNMMADKIFELIKDMKCDKVMLIGGGTLNKALVNILRNRISQVDLSEYASVFEAYGAALWAAENTCISAPANLSDIVKSQAYSFDFHEPLKKSAHLVTFKNGKRIKLHPGAVCILGLDVGSTTTKAVLMHKDKGLIAASSYVRTNGNPVEASKNCYREIREQLGDIKVNIVGMGVTGSGRQIAALHALANYVVNEIIAHATAAAHFDADVDTIFEIGGQDAKYTYLTGGVPSDYAMNEACSAGTGSFLEEAAKESLNVRTEDIGSLAMQGDMPPNFNDQCAAFISSDVKRAGQEGISKNDILGGLVYSISMNYLNRVKKSRPVGSKIFMQGGVCYNEAVPVAMAALIKTPIIVPPDPGLMGAYGIALEVKKQQDLGLLEPMNVDLDELINRNAETIGSFICAGGREKCDRKCEISKIKINDEMYPFGGACDRYYNMRLKKNVDASQFDYVAIRQELFSAFLPENLLSEKNNDSTRKTVGIMRSFLSHAIGILYTNFFSELGFDVVMPDQIDPEGITRIEASFCLPAEISHGSFLNLIKKNLDYIFLPHVAEIPVPNSGDFSKTCVFVQSEPYYLKTTFRREIENANTKILSPFIKMRDSYDTAKDVFVDLAVKLGIDKKRAMSAFKQASDKQQAFESELLEQGKQALSYLNKHPDEIGIVLFGRPYNAFPKEVNMGIPHKVASRGVMVIPYDMLPIRDYKVHEKMYWAMGQKIMKTAQFVKERENLFGFYITNFSCGPDSFILGYFRNLMGSKPSLTLELDQHTADGGIDTRIEAALDIMKAYRTMADTLLDFRDKNYKPAQVIYGKNPYVISSTGETLSLQDPRVEIVFPSMGQMGTQGLAALFKGMGMKSRALPIADQDVLLEGKRHSTCKECLPYMLTVGSFVDYLKHHKESNVVTLLFMATGEGPCRLGQYSKAIEDVIHKEKFTDVAVFTLTDENAYAGLGSKLLLKAWQAMVISDVFNEIKSMLNVTAKNKELAQKEIKDIWEKEILPYLEGEKKVNFVSQVNYISELLSKIPLKKDPKSVPVVSLVGEIFVRTEEFSRRNIIKYLEDQGFMVKVAPVGEYVCYSNLVINRGIGEQRLSTLERLKIKISTKVQKYWEKKIKSILAKSGLYHYELIEVEKTVDSAKHLIDEKMQGEAILTVGLSLREILNHSCGIISIGPFGCMPSRVSEAVLRKEMNVIGKSRVPGWEKKAKIFEEIDTFPYMFIETDGAPFSQMIEANLEAFVLQAKRLNNMLADISNLAT